MHPPTYDSNILIYIKQEAGRADPIGINRRHVNKESIRQAWHKIRERESHLPPLLATGSNAQNLQTLSLFQTQVSCWCRCPGRPSQSSSILKAGRRFQSLSESHLALKKWQHLTAWLNIFFHPLTATKHERLSEQVSNYTSKYNLQPNWRYSPNCYATCRLITE